MEEVDEEGEESSDHRQQRWHHERHIREADSKTEGERCRPGDTSWVVGREEDGGRTVDDGIARSTGAAAEAGARGLLNKKLCRRPTK